MYLEKPVSMKNLVLFYLVLFTMFTATTNHTFSPVQNAYADSVEWTGSGDGTSWSDGANWSTGNVPDTADDITIGSGFTVHLDQDLDVEASIFVESGATLEIDTGNTVTIFQGGGVTTEGDIVNRGTIDIFGSLESDEPGTITNWGTITNDVDELDPDIAGTLDNNELSTVHNHGVITNIAFVHNYGTLINYGDGTIVNNSTYEDGWIIGGPLENHGSFTNAANSFIAFEAPGTIFTDGAFVNDGTMNLDCSVPSSGQITGPITGSGTVPSCPAANQPPIITVNGIVSGVVTVSADTAGGWTTNYDFVTFSDPDGSSDIVSSSCSRSTPTLPLGASSALC